MLVRLEITPSPINLFVGERQSLIIRGYDAEGDTGDLTNNPNIGWTSDTQNFIDIDVLYDEKQVLGVFNGQTTIQAVYTPTGLLSNKVEIIVKSSTETNPIYMASELITQAYFSSGILSRHMQTLSGQQLADGLIFLNDLLMVNNVDYGLIPYYTGVDFNLEGGKEKYFFEHLVSVENMAYIIGTLRLPLEPAPSRIKYFSAPKALTMTTVPSIYHFERIRGGGNIYITPTPNTTYAASIWGKFGTDNVDKDSDLLLVYDREYITYLRFALAEYICASYNRILNPVAQRILETLRGALMRNVSPPDLSVRTASSFRGGNRNINFAVANLNPTGWWP